MAVMTIHLSQALLEYCGDNLVHENTGEHDLQWPSNEYALPQASDRIEEEAPRTEETPIWNQSIKHHYSTQTQNPNKKEMGSPGPVDSPLPDPGKERRNFGKIPLRS